MKSFENILLPLLSNDSLFHVVITTGVKVKPRLEAVGRETYIIHVANLTEMHMQSNTILSTVDHKTFCTTEKFSVWLLHTYHMRMRMYCLYMYMYVKYMYMQSIFC